jgi:hypothetical protein
MINANGYHYVRTEKGWQSKHQLIAEERLGRPLLTTEMVRFKDRNRNNLSPDNIEVIPRRPPTIPRQLARLDAQIAELTAQRDLLLQQLAQE